MRGEFRGADRLARISEKVRKIAGFGRFSEGRKWPQKIKCKKNKKSFENRLTNNEIFCIIDELVHESKQRTAHGEVSKWS